MVVRMRKLKVMAIPRGLCSVFPRSYSLFKQKYIMLGNAQHRCKSLFKSQLSKSASQYITSIFVERAASKELALSVPLVQFRADSGFFLNLQLLILSL